ncbi:PatB family C-S lyase [Winogradskya consettensis]|uniref:cysteine-S-conjugate beta-lyase n=1 Tax=Winogradskya consettensis TaxID=113560 RepID=A0A919VW08_9ACTN|nr:amino acid aminotransferase [Actinoplanes consettensis]
MAVARWDEPLRHDPDPAALGPDRTMTQGEALLHLYEEMAQHHGQMEVLRDTLQEAAVQEAAAQEAEAEPTQVTMEWLRAKRGVKWHRPGPELLPAWVADMDFPVAPPVRDAIHATIARGDLGYPDWPRYPLAVPFAERMSRRYGWKPDPDRVRPITDLIQALQIVLTLTTAPGDGVAVFTPSYPPFLATIESMNRRLIRAGAATAELSEAKVLLLVNPHNPTGHVYSRAELDGIADLAERHDLLVISDEIHAELSYTGHIPFASLNPRTAARTVTVTSATKAFNLAGLRTALAHVGPDDLRARWDAQPPDLYGAVNVLGVEATLAAWEHGDDWLRGVNDHLRAQRDHLALRVHAELSGVTMHVPEAGYLAWLDCAGAGLPGQPADWFRRHAGVELSAGLDFGPEGDHHARLNFATTREILDRIVDAMAAALRRSVHPDARQPALQ